MSEPIEKAIETHIDLGPVSTAIARGLRLNDIDVELAQLSFPVELRVRSGRTSEQAFNSPQTRFAKTLQRGKNRTVRQRRGDDAVILRLRQNTLDHLWSLERLDAAMVQVGRSRGGVR